MTDLESARKGYRGGTKMRSFCLSALLGVALCIDSVQAAEIVVGVKPPRLLVERRPVRPTAGHVWIGGYHRWDGHAYVWEPGRWDLPPRPHAVWVAPRWEHRSNGYVLIEGRWR